MERDCFSFTEFYWVSNPGVDRVHLHRVLPSFTEFSADRLTNQFRCHLLEWVCTEFYRVLRQQISRFDRIGIELVTDLLLFS